MLPCHPLSTDISVIRVRCGVLPGGTKMPDFVILCLTVFRQNASVAILALCDVDLRTSVSFVVRPSQKEAVVYLENGLTYNHQISYEHPH